MTDDPNHELAALRAQVSTLVARIGALEGVRGQRVFVARHDGAGGDWQELVATGDGTTLGDFVGGRHSTTNDIVIDLAAAADVADVCAVLQTRTADGRQVFLQLTGAPAGGGELFGMIEYTGAQFTLVVGWAPIVNTPPV